MKGFVLGVGCGLLMVAATVFVVSRFGLFPIGADNPPSALERNLAGRAMNVYVDAHMPVGQNPMAPTPGNLTAGARNYEQHCALCHGGATAKISPLRDKFSPPAPQLINRIPHDPDSWLFWVTKHGVRLSGMPAWDGIMSDDEMWQTVAFIKHSNQLPADVEAAWRSGAVRQ